MNRLIAPSSRGFFTCVLAALLVLGCGGEGGDAETSASSPIGGPAGAGPAEGTGGMPSGAGAPGAAGTNMTPPEEDPSAGGAGAPTGELGEAELIVQALSFPSRFALDDAAVYVANRTSSVHTQVEADEVLVVPHDGSERSVLSTVPGIASLASVDDQVWVLSMSEGTITRVAKASGVQQVEPSPLPVTITQNETSVFLFTLNPFTVFEIALDTGSPAGSWNWPDHSGVVYWAAADQAGVAFTTYLTGRQDEQLSEGHLLYATTPVTEPTVLQMREAFMVDVALLGDDVLFSDNTTGTVERIPRSGGTPTKIVDLEYAWALALDGEHIYATARPDLQETSTAGQGQVVRFKHDGSEFEVLAEGLDAPSQIEVTPRGIYWVNSGDALLTDDGAVAQADGSLMRLRKL